MLILHLLSYHYSQDFTIHFENIIIKCLLTLHIYISEIWFLIFASSIASISYVVTGPVTNFKQKLGNTWILVVKNIKYINTKRWSNIKISNYLEPINMNNRNQICIVFMMMTCASVIHAYPGMALSLAGSR